MRRQTSGPCVYFLKCDDAHGPIKIGYTADLEQRLKNLQAGSPYPLELLAHTPGLRHHERLLHERFVGGRLDFEGEWFRGDTAGLHEFIEAIDANQVASRGGPEAPEQAALVDAFYEEANHMKITAGEEKAIYKWRDRFEETARIMALERELMKDAA